MARKTKSVTKLFVLDTNVLMHDPTSLFRFEEHDVFLPMGVGWNPDTYELNIFDRWGNNCFITQEVNKGWDGKANNGAEIAQIDT